MPIHPVVLISALCAAPQFVAEILHRHPREWSVGIIGVDNDAARESRRSQLPPSAAPYGSFALRLYDAFVLHFTSPWAWGCKRQIIAELYETHGTPMHAEVGVGSGYFLRGLKKHWETLALLDPNPATLKYTAGRLTSDHIESYEANVLNAEELPAKRFDSVAANYLLHCLPGPPASKVSAIANLATLTADDGTLFGATVLGYSANHNTLGRIVMWACNRTGTFGNAGDTEQQLQEQLERHFSEVIVRRQNTVAVFVATNPRRSTEIDEVKPVPPR